MTTIEVGEDTAASSLLSAAAVRTRCNRVLEAAESDELAHFKVHLDRLESVADYVTETIHINYPDLNIPFHARWRHFKFAGTDRWLEMLHKLDVPSAEVARIQFDLVVTSVLLDAGAGATWRYHDTQTGNTYNRSEGLALASLDAFADGLFSSSATQPLMADAQGLEAITTEQLATAFQVTGDNPLEGLSGRVALLNGLGAALRENPDYFQGTPPRVGHLVDWIVRKHETQIDAPTLLTTVLKAFGSIWPGRLTIDGVNLGDTWSHPAIKTDNATNELIPFHKLSQWLTYSLIEPLQDHGITVTDVDGLTGLAEYRNGGLFVDLGAIEVRDPEMLDHPHRPDAPIIVEWRALTVALLDKVAVHVRKKLEMSPDKLPLASILEGGTWSAGRRIAAQKRPDAGPPIQIISDGSVF